MSTSLKQLEPYALVYISAHLSGLYTLAYRRGGEALSRKFAHSFNSTAKENGLSCELDDGVFRANDIDINVDTYRILLQKVVHQAKRMIGKNLVEQQLEDCSQQLNKEFDCNLYELAWRLGLSA